MIVPARACQFQAEQISAAFGPALGGHPHRQFATARMAHHEHSGPTVLLPEDAIHHPVSEVDPLFGSGGRLRIGGGAAIAGPVEGNDRESVRGTGP